MDPILLGIIIALVLILLIMIIIQLVRKRPLIIRKVLELDTTGNLPDYPPEVALCLQCGMKAGDGGETLALINYGEQAKIMRSSEQVELPDERKKAALGIMLLFNTDRPIKYPAQTIKLKATDLNDREVEAEIDLPEVTGKDGENAFFYIDKAGCAYWATENHHRKDAPDLDDEKALKSKHRAR